MLLIGIQQRHNGRCVRLIRAATWTSFVIGTTMGTACDSTTFYFHINSAGLSQPISNIDIEYTIDCKSPEPKNAKKTINRLDAAQVVIPSRSGLLRMTIWAYDQMGCKIGKYSLQRQLGGVDLRPQVDYATLSPMAGGGSLCSIDLTISGQSGQVQARQAQANALPLRCGAEVSSDSEECATHENESTGADLSVRQCRGEFPLGAQITLQADPPWQARWGLPCSAGQSDCLLTVKGPQKLRLSFATGPCSADAVCLEHPASLGESLYGVTGKSSKNAWAVGSNGTTLLWDGYQWNYVPSGVSEPLYAVAGDRNADSREVWAVGGKGTLLHYDGRKWNQLPSPTTSALYGLWVHETRKSIWAVGAGGAVYLNQPEQSDQWQRINTGVTADLFSVTSTGANGLSDTWAVGQGGTILLYSGTSFTPWSVRVTNNSLRSILGLSSNTVWAVGDSATCIQYNGTEWVPKSCIPPGNSLLGITGQLTSGLWAASSGGALWRSDGGSWQSSFESSFAQKAIWRDPGGCTVSVGSNGVLIQSASSGTDEFKQIGTNESLRDLWQGDSDKGETLWAVGDGGTILSRSPDKQWIVQPAPTSYGLRRLWGANAESLWAVGDGGTLLHRVAGRWQLLDAPVANGESLVGITGQAAGSMWIVGNRGTILRYDKDGRLESTGHIEGEPTDIWAASESSVWSVGTNGLLMHFDGTKWQQQSSPTQNDLLSVWGLNEKAIWAVGGSGTVLAYDGTGWQQVYKAPSVYLRVIRGLSQGQSQRLWIGGDSGVLLRWDGATWQSLQTGSTDTVYGLLPSADDSHTESLWAAGDRGRIWSWHQRF